jgi:hypothetical protein
MPGYNRSALIGRGRRFATGQRYALVGQQGPQGGAPPRGFNPTTYLVEPSQADAARRLILSFALDGIVAGANATITQQPQTVFRPERLIIPASIAPNFDIVDIIIGNRRQSAATNAANGSVYSEVAIGTGLLLDTAQPGVQVQLVITNTSAVTRNFRATFLGASVVGSP